MATKERPRHLPRSNSKAFFGAMATAARENDVEKAVENALNTLLRSYMEKRLPDSTIENTYPHSTDGLISIHPPRDSLFGAMGSEADGNTASPEAEPRAVASATPAIPSKVESRAHQNHPRKPSRPAFSTAWEYFTAQGVPGAPSHATEKHQGSGVAPAPESAGESPRETSREMDKGGAATGILIEGNPSIARNTAASTPSATTAPPSNSTSMDAEVASPPATATANLHSTAQTPTSATIPSPSPTTTLTSGEFSILIEAKKQMKFSGSKGAHDRAKVAAQVLYYLKRFQDAGEALPGATLVGDVDELFIIPTKVLTPYLEKEYDWSIAPSAASERNLELFLALKNDPNMNLYVEMIDPATLDLESFLDRLTGVAMQREGMRKIRVSSRSLEKAFLEYQRVAFGGLAVNPKTQMSIFVKSLLGDKNIYLHPVQRNVIVTEHLDHRGKEKVVKYPSPGSDVIFDSAAHELFFEKYDRSGYTLEQQKEITEIGDTLIEELDRRFTGDYWTPAIWVREAHQMIEEQLGSDWREKYVVWDPAAGSKNLTRDYRFKELYSSTLHQEELSIAEDYNKEGVAFQYDFLNDDIALHDASRGLFSKRPSEMTEGEKAEFLEEQRGKWKLPDGLIEALVYNKPLVFLGNPPYGQHTSTYKKEAKVGVSATGIKEMMKGEKVGSSAANELYTQFMYRMMKLAELFGYTGEFYVFLFTKNFLPSHRFSAFTTKYRSAFSFLDGFMLNAGEFKGTSSAWGIIFTGWGLNATGKENIKYRVLASTARDEVESRGEWELHDVPRESTINYWVQGSKPDPAQEEIIGHFVCHSSKMQEAESGCWIQPMEYKSAGSYVIARSNLEKIAVSLSVRKALAEITRRGKLLWVRDKDVFPAPTQEFQNSDGWGSFVDDCVVYSLFASGSNQTSLRDYIYGVESDGVTPRKWRVNNEFFWESRELIRDLAMENKIPAIEKDLATDDERYVYNYLQTKRGGGELSFEAEVLLSKAREIIEASFKYRELFHEEAPIYNTLSWDMGWLQVQRMCFGRDALSFAKADDELQALYGEFKVLRSALGEKIATRYSEDTGF